MTRRENLFFLLLRFLLRFLSAMSPVAFFLASNGNNVGLLKFPLGYTYGTAQPGWVSALFRAFPPEASWFTGNGPAALQHTSAAYLLLVYWGY